MTNQHGPPARSSDSSSSHRRGSGFSKPLSRSERLRRLRIIALRLPSIEMRNRLHEAAERAGLSAHAFALKALQDAVDAALREASHG